MFRKNIYLNASTVHFYRPEKCARKTHRTQAARILPQHPKHLMICFGISPCHGPGSGSWIKGVSSELSLRFFPILRLTIRYLVSLNVYFCPLVRTLRVTAPSYADTMNREHMRRNQ